MLSDFPVKLRSGGIKIKSFLLPPRPTPDSQGTEYILVDIDILRLSSISGRCIFHVVTETIELSTPRYHRAAEDSLFLALLGQNKPTPVEPWTVKTWLGAANTCDFSIKSGDGSVFSNLSSFTIFLLNCTSTPKAGIARLFAFYSVRKPIS